jgi:ribose/xylose/arabinose/galactoside ABC-type transport system permease subunit
MSGKSYQLSDYIFNRSVAVLITAIIITLAVMLADLDVSVQSLVFMTDIAVSVAMLLWILADYANWRRSNV